MLLSEGLGGVRPLAINSPIAARACSSVQPVAINITAAASFMRISFAGRSQVGVTGSNAKIANGKAPWRSLRSRAQDKPSPLAIGSLPLHALDRVTDSK
jgi:hypothetical protein